MAHKPEIIVLTKMDMLANEKDRKAAQELIEQGISQKTMRISAAMGLGLTEVLEACWTELGKNKPNATHWNSADSDQEKVTG